MIQNLPRLIPSPPQGSTRVEKAKSATITNPAEESMRNRLKRYADAASLTLAQSVDVSA